MKHLMVILATAVFLAFYCSACGDDLGACDSTGRYCGDNYSEDECNKYNAEEVNNENWYFHSGQSCADRGKESTS